MKKINIFYAQAVLFLITIFLTHTLYANDNFHQPFSEVLSESVHNGLVDYKKIENNPKFLSYIESLEEETNFENTNEELAYWINAYNALVIHAILNGGSPRTIFSRIGFFKKNKYHVNGQRLSLYDIEHDMLLPLSDPRIHFAINCASRSRPKIKDQAYSAENLDAELTQAATDFINDTMRNHFDHSMNIASISKIFDWFKGEFVKHSGSVEEYLAQYIKDEKVANALREGNYKIKYLVYDWSLNGTK